MSENTIEYDKYQIEPCYECATQITGDPIHIPHKYDGINMDIAYGSFCRYECAQKYILKNSYDDNVMYEQYCSLNCEYKLNIGPPKKPKRMLLARNGPLQEMSLDETPKFKIRLKKVSCNKFDKQTKLNNFFRK